ncbi:sphingosine kinase 1 [Polypterus senegalus]|uniref:sphingosine kinase 1 n=1 Tax=Polypterus senegalus TaxID=55291 RepID=UPI0019659279|nr:sphingosine kinase 1 [Polypterus senegalus]
MGEQADGEFGTPVLGDFDDPLRSGRRCVVTLSAREMSVQRSGYQSREVMQLVDCIGCQVTGHELSVYFYPFGKSWPQPGTARQRLVLRFKAENDEMAQRWAWMVRERSRHELPAQDGCRYGLLPQVCRALVLVNPQGGSGQAVSIFHNQVKKMLMEADIQYTLLVTDKQNHARDLMRTAELSQWDIVVILSGDGLIFEVINGLMERADWCDAIQKPLAILPGGSGNALASSINNYSRFPPVTGNHLLLNCTFLLCKGLISPMDLMSVTTASGHRLFSFLSVSWGFVSDVDIESERLRPIGGARFTLGTLWRLASLRVYQGKVAYLSLEAKTDSSPNSQQFTTGTNGPKDTLLVPLDQPVPSHWTLVEDEELVLVLAACQTHLGEDFICAPAALLSDGIIHLIVVKAGISRSALLSLFLAMEKGTHLQVQSPHVLYIQTRAFRLVPHSTKGYMTVDGERVECGPIQAQVHHQLGRVISG